MTMARPWALSSLKICIKQRALGMRRCWQRVKPLHPRGSWVGMRGQRAAKDLVDLQGCAHGSPCAFPTEPPALGLLALSHSQQHLKTFCTLSPAYGLGRGQSRTLPHSRRRQVLC